MKTEPLTRGNTAANRIPKAAEGILPEIRSLIEAAQHRAITVANSSMVSLYWSIGRVINTKIHSQPGRGNDGEALLAHLGERMKAPLFQAFFAIDRLQVCRYARPIISPVASVAGREAGSLESASAFSAMPA